MRPLWTPQHDATTQSQLGYFIQYVNAQHQMAISDYPALHTWSVEQPALFWKAVWDFCDVVATTQPELILKPADEMQKTKWFCGAELNFAENLLKRRDQHTAIIFESERDDSREMTYAALYESVERLAAHLKATGLKAGDRVAGCLPNLPETIIAMLATTSLGGVWSSCSPDFGLQGLLDRFGQIEPTVLFASDGHYYNGKTYRDLSKIADLQAKLPSLKQTIIVPYIDDLSNQAKLTNTIVYDDALQTSSEKLDFTPIPFNHPLYILYSSGTTGKPKCMVHGVGGTLLQHLKELMLHTDVRADDRFFFFTTCGWMMWNWLVSGLALGATLVLYDGSPFYPKPNRLFNLIDEAKISIFGAGAKFIESAEKAKLKPKSTHDLSSLKTVLSTGSPLLPQSFDYLYNKVKANLRVCSISGGSDIISCFALGNPLLPVYRGELQCKGLGMNIAILNEEGQSVLKEKGELVCLTPFPCMPLYFWDDPHGEKYQKAYFNQYKNIWAHGDYAEITEREGLIIYGRSDTTLNPGGIRIGTAEIYQQVEHFPEILDALAVGQNTSKGERIILFVILQETSTLTNSLKQAIKNAIRDNASPHHAPAKIIAVPDLPRTISGKLVELAVKKIIHGEEVNHTEALANPESLVYFKNLKELQ